MSVLADRASGAGVLDRLQVLRSAPTPLRGAPAATWPPSPRTGVRQLRVAGPGLQPWLQDTTTTRTDPAGSTLATPVLGPRNGVHLQKTINELRDYRNKIAHWWTGRLDYSYADDIQRTVVKLLRSKYGLGD